MGLDTLAVIGTWLIIFALVLYFLIEFGGEHSIGELAIIAFFIWCLLRVLGVV